MMDGQGINKVSYGVTSLIYFNKFVDPPKTLLHCPLLIHFKSGEGLGIVSWDFLFKGREGE